ncbi:MAG TPA: aryl-sulfate sulfotransferase [Solirubrobacterales bacterium]
MGGGRTGTLAVVALSILALAGQLSAAPGAGAQPPADQAHFSVVGLKPTYDPQVHDYVVRCKNGPVTVEASASAPWQAAVSGHPYASGDQSVVVPLRTGREFSVSFRGAAGSGVHRYFVRCLPSDFPRYTFTKGGPVSPGFFTADNAFAPRQHRYAMIFDTNGVPVWWNHGPAEGPSVLSDGRVLWFHSNGQASKFELHGLNGGLIRGLPTVGGAPVDGHDLQVLADGSYLVGAHSQQTGVDTSAYGGSANADVANAELQQVSPQGRLLWDWKSQNHLSLRETGRWWPHILAHPITSGYDVVHWNSIEPRGNAVIASLRAVDAIYKIDKRSGSIAWKLGGKKTSRSLKVLGDPNNYTLGGQHDARVHPDGTLTAFDNRSFLANDQPRAVQFSINQNAGTATLLRSITDPEIPVSYCCGSARRMPNQDWLIDWGQETTGAKANGAIGGYTTEGERTFLLRFKTTFSYRAQPVPPDAVTPNQLRKGMDAMCASGCP